MYKLVLVTVIPEVPPRPRSVWLRTTRYLAPSPRCGRPILAAKKALKQNHTEKDKETDTNTRKHTEMESKEI